MKKIDLDGQIPMNCYVIDHDGNCFIIDPGYPDSRISAYVEGLGLEVLGVLLTHGHPDHVGGIGMFNVPIYVHLEDDRMIEKRKKGTRTPSGFDMPFDYMTFHRKLVEEGTVIPFGNSEIKVVHTPGHSEGGVCYVFDKDIFVGDTLFSGGVGRWDFSTGDYEKLKQSVMRIIDTFPQDYAIHSGHGDSTTVGRERSSNPYYLKWKNL